MHAATNRFAAGGAAFQQSLGHLNCVHQQSVYSRNLVPRPARSLKLDAQESQTHSSVRDSSTSSSGNGRLQNAPPEINGTGSKSASVAVQPMAASVQDADSQDQVDSVYGTSERQSPAWYAAVGLSAIAALICSVDRAAISVAILPMSEEFGWSDSTKGAINRCVDQCFSGWL